MGERFRKIKKQRRAAALIKSAACGVALGLFVAGAVLLAFKLAGIGLLWVCAPAGALGLAVGFFAAFFVLRPTDRRIAEQLDNEYALGERVQTALEYAGAEGTMLSVQREDAESKLAELPRRRSVRGIWKYAAADVLAVALAVTAIALPVGRREADADGYTPSLYDKAAVTELIANVRSSALDDARKQGTVAALEAFSAKIETVGKRSEIEREVSAAVTAVEGVLSVDGAYTLIAKALSDAGRPSLAAGYTEAMEIAARLALVSYSEARSFYANRLKAVSDAVEKYTKDARTELSVKIGEGLADALGKTAAAIAMAIPSTGLEADHELCVPATALAAELNRIAAGLGGEDDAANEDAQSEIDAAFSDFYYRIAENVSEPAYVLVMRRFVGNRLKIIFKLPVTAPLVDSDTDDGGGGGQSSEDDNGGGYGGGETLYGGDDVVYDPRTGEYVKFGTLLEEYYAEVEYLLRTEELTPEQKRMIEDYFQKLFSGIKPTEEEV